MSQNIQELQARKAAIESELAIAIAELKEREQQSLQAKQDELDKGLKEKYEEQLQEIEAVIAKVNQASEIIETQLKKLTSLYKANGAMLPSGKRLKTIFVVPANYEAYNYSLPYFKERNGRFIFQKKNARLLS